MTDKPKKTTTIVVHHDECDADSWTAHDIIAFAKFIKTGQLTYAAKMRRSMGLQVITSELHSPAGGTLELIGVSAADDKNHERVYECVSEMYHEGAEDEVFSYRDIHAGPVRYAAAVPCGDEHGEYTHTDFELFDTKEQAMKYLAGLRESAA